MMNHISNVPNSIGALLLLAISALLITGGIVLVSRLMQAFAEKFREVEESDRIKMRAAAWSLLSDAPPELSSHREGGNRPLGKHIDPAGSTVTDNV